MFYFVLQVARMVMVVALSFIVAWTPFYVISFVTQVQKTSFLKRSNFLFTMLSSHLVGFLNSCVNPIIYHMMNEKFRRSFRRMARNIFPKCISVARRNSMVLVWNGHKNSPRRHRLKRFQYSPETPLELHFEQSHFARQNGARRYVTPSQSQPNSGNWGARQTMFPHSIP